MLYHEKYDPNNVGTTYVFDKFYEILEKTYKIRSNMIACCGENVERYIKYAKKICKYSTQAFFIENDRERYERINSAVHGINNINTMLGNVFSYVENPSYNMNNPCRVQDIGIGIGNKELIEKAISLIGSQNRGCTQTENKSGLRQWKAQILDGAIRQKKKLLAINAYDKYLRTMNLYLKSINGFDISIHKYREIALDPDKNRIVKKYPDKSTNRTGKVYKHEVVLHNNRKEAKMYMFSCLNGSEMLQSMLVYR